MEPDKLAQVIAELKELSTVFDCILPKTDPDRMVVTIKPSYLRFDTGGGIHGYSSEEYIRRVKKPVEFSVIKMRTLEGETKEFTLGWGTPDEGTT